MSNLHLIQIWIIIAFIMAAELVGSTKSGFYIDAGSSRVMERVREKCPTCPLRDIVCGGMGSTDPRARILGDLNFKKLAEIKKEAPCLSDQ